MKTSNTDKKVKKTQKALSLFGRNVGQVLFIGLGQLAQALKKSKGGIMSTVGKLLADNKVFAATNRAGEIVYACRIPKVFKYTSWELIEHLSDLHFNLIGKWLQHNFSQKKKIVLDVKKLEEHEKELEMPSQFILYFITCFIDCGLVKVDSASKTLSYATSDKDLSARSLRKVCVAKSLREVAHKSDKVSGETDPLKVLRSLHLKHEQDTGMIVVPVEVEGPFRIHHICEIRIGHQDTDFEELESTIVSLEATLPANRPQVLVVSGLIQGTFQHLQKNRRNTLVSGLKSDGQQLDIAKTLMKRISALGMKVVLNMSDDDKLWCENTTVFMMKALEAQDKTGQDKEKEFKSDNKKKSAHFMQVDRMKGTKIWDTIYSFVWKVALEYQIRVGRRLHSADEVSVITSGTVHMEESILLMDAYNRLVNGDTLTADHVILEVDKIPLPGKVFDDFVVVDDCKFEVLIKDKATGTERRLSIMEKHFFRLTANSMVGDPTSAVRSITAQLNSMKEEKPDVVFIEHEQQAFVFATDHTLVASLPGMQKMNIGRRSQFANVQSDPSHRVMTTRKDVFGGGTMPITFYPDGSFEVFMVDRRLMDKASISDQRIKIPFMVDWQNGSVTANADLQAIFMDYTMHHLLPNHPTWVFYGGDHVQGFNYPTHCFESQRVGLVSVDSQKEFVNTLIKCALVGASKEDIRQNLKHVGIVPGNHEWNSGHKNLGIIHCEYVKHAWELALVHCGMYTSVVPPGLGAIHQPVKIEIYDSARDNAGNHYKVWAGQEDIGGYGFRFQHLVVERGTKGQGGPPIYALKSQLVGNSESFKGVDLLATGHWHSPQVLKMGNVTGMVSGSLAGTSGYEYLKALHATTGCSVLSVGGGLPPSILFLNTEALSRYKPKGFYSRENLASIGFRNDNGFDRLKHGFARFNGQPQSAIQKFLWSVIDGLNWDKGTILGS